MNKAQSRLARIRIRGRKYNKRRWEQMIEEAQQYELRSHMCRNKEDREALFHKEMMYRKRAAWYIIKIIQKRTRR